MLENMLYNVLMTPQDYINSEYKPITINYNFERQTVYRNRRDELVNLITSDINLLRVGTKYKPTTTAVIAKMINRNPFLAKSDGEVELLYKECNARRNYSKFFYVLK